MSSPELTNTAMTISRSPWYGSPRPGASAGRCADPGRSDQIAEQRTDDLPLVPGHGRVRLQRTATRTAEAEALRVLLSATGARRHTSSVRREPEMFQTATPGSR